MIYAFVQPVIACFALRFESIVDKISVAVVHNLCCKMSFLVFFCVCVMRLVTLGVIFRGLECQTK